MHLAAGARLRQRGASATCSQQSHARSRGAARKHGHRRAQLRGALHSPTLMSVMRPRDHTVSRFFTHTTAPCSIAELSVSPGLKKGS
jgi:hypothetical protein